METKHKKEKKSVKADTSVQEKKNYAIIDGKKVSKTWAAILAHKGTGEILDMREVLK